jgi:Holliday junction resolvase RusA-like endonuclease
MTLRFEALPLSTNHLYSQSRNGRFLTDRARRNKDLIGWEARAQYKGKPLTDLLKVAIDLYWPDKRKHDVDNIKTLLDSLNGIVWEDDGQIVDLHTRKFYDKADPRVEMTIIPG